MITRRSLAARTNCVIAIAAFAIGVAPSAIAQDLRGVPPESRGVPWWAHLQLPDPETSTALLQNVLATPASTFDPTLPPFSLDAWLLVTLAPHVEVLHSPLVNWNVRNCGAYAAGTNPAVVTASGPELCAEGTVQISAERNVHLLIVVAEAVRGSLQWRPTVPYLRYVYIERVNEMSRIDSLDVPGLGSLPDMLQTPFDQWPKVDFKSEITWDPLKPVPGTTVRFSISVRNTGKRAADRAWIEVMISPCCVNDVEIRRSWFPYIAAGQSVRVDFEVPLPEGRAMATVSVRLGPSEKMVRDAHPDRRPTFAGVGHPPHP